MKNKDSCKLCRYNRELGVYIRLDYMTGIDLYGRTKEDVKEGICTHNIKRKQMKATAYSYLKAKYGKKIVKKVFKILELDKSRPMPTENVRGSGNTTVAVLEAWLHKYTTKRRTLFIGRHEPENYKSNSLDFMMFERVSGQWVFEQLYKDLSEELDNELT